MFSCLFGASGKYTPHQLPEFQIEIQNGGSRVPSDHWEGVTFITSQLEDQGSPPTTQDHFILTEPPTPDTQNKRSTPEEVTINPPLPVTEDRTLEDPEAQTFSQCVSSDNVYESIVTQSESSPRQCSEDLSTTIPKEKPKTSQEVLQSLERRRGVPLNVQRDRESQIVSKPISQFPKDPEERRVITEALSKNEFLSKILKDQLVKDVVDAMYNRQVKAKERIIKEGDEGAHMYVSTKGSYKVIMKNVGTVATFDYPRAFGELAILYNAKRTATVKVIESGNVWVLDRTVYQQLMVRTSIQEEEERFSFLRKVDVLNTVGNDALRKVASLLQVEFFAVGKQVFKQGDRGDKFYIIRAGTVTISTVDEGEIGKRTTGHYFGEQALLYEDVRAATVTSDVQGVECLTLKRKHFIDHFGQVEGFSQISMKTPKKALSTSNTAEFMDVELRDLAKVKTLGVGGFGRVELVQHRTRLNLTFALKVLKKKVMVDLNQQDHVLNERNLQMPCRSMFITRFYRTYKNRKYVYFLMEPSLGGDLWSLFRKQKYRRFQEDDARFIAACVLEAFAYLHERDIVFRDLKPENLLIDKDGYIKLTDFGFAKKLGPKGRTFTFAGTPEYVAPEIILSRGHDKSVDFWSFGVFIFELLTGRTPFYSNDPHHMKTYNKILSGIDNADFPEYVRHSSTNLIRKLCRSLPMERLGSKMNGIEDIRNHKWFNNFDWAKLNNKQIEPPFIPKLKSNIDTRYFDSFKEDSDVPPDEDSGWDRDL